MNEKRKLLFMCNARKRNVVVTLVIFFLAVLQTQEIADFPIYEIPAISPSTHTVYNKTAEHKFWTIFGDKKSKYRLIGKIRGNFIHNGSFFVTNSDYNVFAEPNWDSHKLDLSDRVSYRIEYNGSKIIPNSGSSSGISFGGSNSRTIYLPTIDDNVKNRLYFWNRISYSEGSRTKDGNAYIYFDVIGPVPPRVSLNEEILNAGNIVLYNEEVIDGHNHSILYYSDYTPNENLSLEFYIPHTNEGYLESEVLLESQSGFKGYIVNDRLNEGFHLYKTNELEDTNDCISFDKENALYTIYGLDKLHNPSVPLFLTIDKDDQAPSVNMQIVDYKYTDMNPDNPVGKFSVEIPIFDHTIDQYTTGISVVDDKSGLGHSQAYLYIEQDGEYIKVSDVDLAEATHDGDYLRYKYLERGVNYKVVFAAEDNVGNIFEPDDIKGYLDQADSLYIPILPVLDTGTDIMSWDQDTLLLKGTLLLDDNASYEGVVQTDLMIERGGELESVYQWSREDLLAFPRFDISLPQEAYWDWLIDNAHQDVELTVRTMLTSGRTIDQPYFLPPYENRIPSHSGVQKFDIIENDSEWTILTIDNIDSLYDPEWRASDNGGLQGLLEDKLATGEEFEDFSFNSGILTKTLFVDYDGDQITFFSDLLIDGSDSLFCYIKESGYGIVNYYLLPYRFSPDNEAPSFNDFTLTKNGETLDTTEVIQEFTFIANDHPDSIVARDVKIDDIAFVRIKLSDSNRGVDETVLWGMDDQRVDIINGEIHIEWPDEFEYLCLSGEEYLFDFTIELLDAAGNPASQSRGLIIDRAKPALNLLSDGVVRNDSEQVSVSFMPYEPIPGGDILVKAEVTFNSNYYKNDDFGLWKYAFSDPVPYDITPLDWVDGAETFSFTFNADCLPDTLVPIELSLSDQAGNSNNAVIRIASPARMSLDDVAITGEEEQSYQDWSGSHCFGFDRIGNPEWSYVRIDRKEGSTWVRVIDEVSLSETFYDEDVKAHGSYQYRITPINASGEPYEEGAVVTDTVIQGNYLPLSAYDDDNLIINNDQAYIGANSTIPLSIDDRDGYDIMTTAILLGNEKAPVKWGESTVAPGTDMVISSFPGQEVSIEIPSADINFVNGEEYLFSLETTDNNGGVASSGIRSFVYDSHGPAVESTKLINPNNLPYGATFLRVGAIDDGSGVGRVWGVNNSDNSEIDGIQSEEDGFYYIELPNGEYDLTVKLEDRLGNQEGSGDIYHIVRDTTPPVISSALFDQTVPKYEVSGVYTYDSPLVKIDLNWSDNLGQIESLIYYFRKGDEIVCQGERVILTNDTDIANLTLSPDRTRIEEGEEYQLYLMLMDKGGNYSDSYEMNKKIRFDLTSPELKLSNWLADTWGDYFVTKSSSVVVPEVEVIDTISENTAKSYRLLDANGIELSGMTLPSQGIYTYEVKATDEAGLSSRLELPLVYDNQGPENLTLNGYSTTESYKPGKTLILSLDGDDNFTGIESYGLELRSEGSVFLTREFSPEEAAYFSLTLPETAVNDLDVFLSAEDGAGNVTGFTSAGQISLAGEADDLVLDVPLYYGKGQTFNASWEFKGIEEISHYKSQIMALTDTGSYIVYNHEGTNPYLIVEEDSLGELGAVTGLVLSVRPVTSEGAVLSAVQSPVVAVDLEVPEIISFVTPETLRPGQWPISWEISDDSPLKPIRISYETVEETDGEIAYVNGGDIVLENSTAAGERNVSYLAPANLYDNFGAVRLRLTAQDRAGNLSEVISPLIALDPTAAPAFTILDGGDYIDPEQNDLTFSWFWAEEDPETDTLGYLYRLVGGENVSDEWIFTNERSITFPGSTFKVDDYEDSTEVFLLVRAVTSAGEEEIHYSNGIVIDRSAPIITRVGLATGEGEVVDDIYYSGTRDLNLTVDGYDNQSGIDRFLARGMKGDAASYDELDLAVLSESDVIPVTLPVIEEGALLSFRVTAFNGTNAESLPSWSPGIKYSPDEPEIGQVLLTLEEGKAHVVWTALGGLPLESQTVEFYETGSSSSIIASVDLDGGARSADFDGLSLNQGSYAVKITLRDRGGRETVKLSPFVIYDKDAPSFTNLTIPEFVYDNLTMSLVANEAVTNVQWELTDGGQILAEEYDDLNGSYLSWTYSVDMETLDDWEELKNTGTGLLSVRLRMRDVRGNWSDWTSRTVIFDGTAPATPLLNRDDSLYWGATRVTTDPPQVGEDDQVGNFHIYAREEESPLAGYRWGVTPLPAGEPDWDGQVLFSEDLFMMERDGITLDGLNLTDGVEFYIALQTFNRVGLDSEIVYYGPLVADLSPPAFSLTPREELRTESVGDTTVYVFQGELDVQLVVADSEMSPYLIETVVVTDPRGGEGTHTIEGIDLGVSHEKTLSLTFDAEMSGIHTIQVGLEDLQGRKTVENLYVMSSALPVIDIPDNITVRPGEERVFEFNDYKDWFQAGAALTKLTLTGGALEDDLSINWEDQFILPTHYHSEEDAQETVFTYKARFTDIHGIYTEKDMVVTLKNSSDGELLVDETWSGTHYITGQVTVPAGRTLTIEPGTTVIARTGFLYGSEQELILEQGGTLTIGDDVVFTAEDPDSLWKGITLAGTASLANVTVEKAHIGLRVLDTATPFMLDGCRFAGNEIGVHLLSPDATVTGCTFEENRWYGLKEDGSADPILTDNSYSNNGYDYYDIDLGALNLGSGN